ncbi:hypothetical protein RQP46_006178 [Phenoliferia psychrophenolica]
MAYEDLEKQQRFRFSFGLVSRAFYLATAGATTFVVQQDEQAKALTSKLVRERKRVAQEAKSGIRTPGIIVQVSNVRRLSLLIPLRALEELDIGGVWWYITDVDAFEIDALIENTALPHLRELWISIPREPPGPPVLLSALAKGSAGGLLTLNLCGSPVTTILPFLDTLTPYLSSVVNFDWTPRQSRNEEATKLELADREPMLALIGSMTSITTFTMSMWVISDIGRPQTRSQLSREPVDLSLLDTLATLPSLDSVEIYTEVGMLDEEAFVSFIKAVPTLGDLSVYEKTGAEKVPWTQAQCDRVRVAGEEAGMVFRYETYC